MNAAETTQNQQCKHEHNQKAWRGRGGGAAKVCVVVNSSFGGQVLTASFFFPTGLLFGRPCLFCMLR